jgi:hypothetical protein
MANTITLSFAGDTTGAERSFDRVGSAARDMGGEVERTGASFDRAGEAADNVDTKAMGFRDTLTGIQDGAQGIKLAASGEWGFETLLLLGFGIGDLASGLFNFLIPAAKSAALAIKGMNLALLSSPITWIVLGIGALVAAFVILWNKCEGFRNFWKGLWRNIKDWAGSAWTWVKDKSQSTVDWLRKIPDWIKTAFAKIAGFIKSPFTSAFNAVARGWNNTVGQLSWTVPSWVPVIGGNSISVPQLPTFHAGGTVPGFPGQAVPILAMAGERVTNPAGSTRGRDDFVPIRGDAVFDALVEAIARAVGRRGGDPVQLGIRLTR